MYFNLEMSLNYTGLEQLPSNLLKINVLLELKVWVIIFRVGGIYFLGSVPENLSLKKNYMSSIWKHMSVSCEIIFSHF